MSNFHKIITNTYTNTKITIAKPTDEEVIIFDNSIMVTETDTLGIITYANRRFIKLSGFTKEELIGSPKSISHHPDTPKGLLHSRVKIVSSKRIWCGYIKSLCKDGKFYWSLMHMQAKVDNKGTIIGYTTTRKKACPEEILEVEKKHREFSGDEHIGHKFFMSATLRHEQDIVSRVYANSSDI